MTTTALIVINVIMSLLVLGAVLSGAVFALRMHAGPEPGEGRATERGPSRRLSFVP